MKTRHHFLSLSLLLLSALWLGSCSEETVTGGDDNNTPLPTEVTKFSSGNPSPDGSPSLLSLPSIFGPQKTLMDRGGNHYWTEGDNIWVHNGTAYVKDVQSTILGTQEVADFWLPGTMTDPQYPVFYIGQNSPQASSSSASTLQVTIPDVQVQGIPSNSEHFGRSGDCGTATATRSGDTYSFKLNHRAAYLIFAPKDPYIEKAGNAKLKKVTVTSDHAICGTYDFTTGHLTNGTSTGNTITLKTGVDSEGNAVQDFPIPTTQDVGTNGAFMVIQPGTHQLTITYTVEYYGSEQDIVKTIASRDFLENRYYTVGQTLNVTKPETIVENFNFLETYYMWDAQKWYWWNQYPFPTMANENYSTYPRSQSSDPLRWANTSVYTESCLNNGNAINSARSMPCFNALTWYIGGGDPHFDDTAEWTLAGVKYRGGLWLKKWEKISGKPSESITNCPSPYPGATVNWEEGIFRYYVYPPTGRPNDTSDYFFLPALGYFSHGTFYGGGTLGRYWSSSALAHMNTYGLHFSQDPGDDDKSYRNSLHVSEAEIYAGYVAGTRPDGSPWFQ